MKCMGWAFELLGDELRGPIYQGSKTEDAYGRMLVHDGLQEMKTAGWQQAGCTVGLKRQSPIQSIRTHKAL